MEELHSFCELCIPSLYPRLWLKLPIKEAYLTVYMFPHVLT